ncbi:hypothetical protein L6270_04345 [Candidatus Parcubacteria bacterium]|nr:hypothetical protein [Patescibacteria group bacterium]MBU4309192.1 hypothetical protein [Patescibacteria group bacterium]MBU4432515.1 hypothetical protein [Patescibacteria group bacterium]MBU4577553.1 hypothetical protein [Patescibacteria group bacterium]MCG2697240.1 hypothetical protein [Candidatus Parcubacteria bacterium]
MTEENFKGKLNSLITDSDLNTDHKILWEIFSKISIPEEDEAVYEAASESNENLHLLTEHLRDKIWDMKNNDAETWARLVADEQRYAKVLES